MHNSGQRLAQRCTNYISKVDMTINLDSVAHSYVAAGHGVHRYAWAFTMKQIFDLTEDMW